MLFVFKPGERGHVAVTKALRWTQLPHLDRNLLVGILFIIFVLSGIANSLNHLLIHQSMKSFGITRLRASLVQSFYYFGYVVAALPAAIFTYRRGYRTSFRLGLFIFAVAACAIAVAGELHSFALLLVPLAGVAAAVSILEISTNPYIFLAGDASTAARRLMFAQGFNSLGMMLGTIIGTYAMFSGIELSSGIAGNAVRSGAYLLYLHRESSRIAAPYFCLAFLALALGLLLNGVTVSGVKRLKGNTGRSVLRPLRSIGFCLSLLTAFVYFGVQICTWSFLLQYVKQFTGATERTGGLLLLASMGLFALGRFCSVVSLKRLDPSCLLLLHSVTSVGLVGAAILKPGWVGVCCIVLTSFFMSVMYPIIFSITVGVHPEQALSRASLLVLAISAGGILPPMVAMLCERTGSFSSAYTFQLYGFGWIAVFALATWIKLKVKPSVAVSEVSGT